MDGASLARLIQTQKQWLQTAKALKGQKRTALYRREDLLRDFSGQPQPNVSMSYVRTTIIGEAYTPCRLPLCDLKKILLNDLELETHHRGRFVILRVFGSPQKLSAIMTALEDETGDVDRLAVYNTNEDLQPEEYLPSNCIIAVKDPYYKMTADGKCILRVDHPSDVVHLHQSHSLLPSVWKRPEISKSSRSSCPADTRISWKLKGNQALARKLYLEALQCYARGFDLTDAEEPDVQRDLFRNRAHVNFLLGRYDTARTDALASLSNSEDQNSKSQDAKALYRCGRAAYQLEDYDDALSRFERVLALSPSDKDALRELTRTKARVREMREGSYDLVALVEQIAKSRFFADRASFISKTKVDQTTTGCGRGLFATGDISFGDLILCEKAFVAAHHVEENASISLMVNLNSNRASTCTSASVWSRIIQKLAHNPSLGPRILNLFPAPGDLQVPIVDGKAVVDTFLVQQIIEYNAFGYDVNQEPEAYGNAARMSKHTHESTGVWSHASYANHACLFNAQRSFIGDMMVMRASKAIPKGTEITIAYQLEPDLDMRQKTLSDAWGFRCSCMLCKTEESVPVNRNNIVKESRNFLEAHPHDGVSVPKPSEVKRAEYLARAFEGSYRENVFRKLPCLLLVPIYVWLCDAYFLLGSLDKMRSTAIKILKSHGYTVDVRGSKVEFDYTNGIPAAEVVDTIVRMSFAYPDDKEDGLRAELIKLAKKVYEILNGTLFGFEDRYGK